MKPLGFVERLFYPLLLFLLRGSVRERLINRMEWTQQLKARRKKQAELVKLLVEEANIYAKMIPRTLGRLGYSYTPKSEAKKRKVQHVRFEQIKTQEEVIWLKLFVSKLTILRQPRDMLPLGVRVADLIDERTLLEISHAVGREVDAVHDARRGVWYRIHRLVGVGGIPLLWKFKDTLEHYPLDMDAGTLVIGIAANREVKHVTMDDHPHFLIAGSTKSGKSNMLNNMICALMLFTEPQDLKFLFIDLKRVEFSFYKTAPHLYKPVITDGIEAIQALRELLQEMERRTVAFEDVKNLETWNKKHPDKRLPRIIAIIDEFASLRLHQDRAIRQASGDLVQQITNMGRAVGVHVWICTQHPMTEIVPNAIKTNMPLVIAGRVQNMDQSRVILGNGTAAEIPLVRGRMIYQSGPEQAEIQTPFITDGDVRWCVCMARGKAAGIVSLDGIMPTINQDALIDFVAMHGGALSEHVGKSLRIYAITTRMFRAFYADVLAMKECVIGNTLYKIEKEHATYRIVAYAMETEPEPIIIEPAPVLKPTLLLLPANVPSTLAAQQIVAPVPDPSLILDEVQRFVHTCCITEPGLETRARDLYIAYQNWAKDRGMPEQTPKVFGIRMAELEFARRKSNGLIIWVGIGLKEALKNAA